MKDDTAKSIGGLVVLVVLGLLIAWNKGWLQSRKPAPVVYKSLPGSTPITNPAQWPAAQPRPHVPRGRYEYRLVLKPKANGTRVDWVYEYDYVYVTD